ncbi:MAG: hypothetical protein HOP13_07305 [Alphaproteobacteria bacterium]|nr:hypothetical protein [Alphaproteobacteria bacterium]
MRKGEFAATLARVHPSADPALSSHKKIDRVLRARREDYAELWALTGKARALRLVHPEWIAERAAFGGKRSGIGFVQKQRLMQRYVGEGKTGFSAPFITRAWAQELKSALLASGIAEMGFPAADLAELQTKLGIDVAPVAEPVEEVAAEPPPSAPVLVPSDGLAQLMSQALYGASGARHLSRLTADYCGLFDIVARERNDSTRDPNGGHAMRSLLVVHAQETPHGLQHVACELVPHLTPGAVARSFVVRSGYAFQVAGACAIVLFDTTAMPAFLATDDGKAFNVAGVPSGPGMKTIYLSEFADDSPLIKASHQTAFNAGVAVARKREGSLVEGRLRVGRDDLRALRRFPISEGSADPIENELIHAARQFPMLHTTIEASPTLPSAAGLRR